MNNGKKVVYTAHSSDSMKFVEWICLYCFERGVIPVNPFATLGYHLHYLGSECCEDQCTQDDIELMLRCDELWVFGETTRGVRMEIDAWQNEKDTPIQYIKWQMVIPRDVLTHYKQRAGAVM